MNTIYKWAVPVTRILFGWLFFYAGITKIINPSWSAAGYLKGAQTFSGFYDFLLQPNVLPFTNFLNEWGLTLLGVSLIFGLWVKYSAPLAALLMLLYYFPVLNFPYVGEHSFLVDEHILYAASLLLLVATRSGMHFGLDKMISNRRKG